MLVVTNVDVCVDQKKLLDTVSLQLLPGHITLLLGPSGAGKTTLLKACAGLLPVRNGSIMVGDTALADCSPQQRAQRIGYLFQEFNLFAHLTVEQNCIDPLLVQGIAPDVARTCAHSWLTKLGMQNFVQAYPWQLSGGQQQRVALARTLCLQPSVLLLDEPTASLDAANVAILIEQLKSLAQQGLSIGVSSHDAAFVRAIFDRAYYLQDGAMVEYCEDRQQLLASARIASRC